MINFYYWKITSYSDKIKILTTPWVLFLFAENFVVKGEIRGIKKANGDVYISIHNSKESYEKKISYKHSILESTDEILNFEVNLPEGYYVFCIFQDINKNKKMDTSIIGLPKEPVGISNYNGKGIPSSFDKLKILINSHNNKAVINMVKI